MNLMCRATQGILTSFHENDQSLVTIKDTLFQKVTDFKFDRVFSTDCSQQDMFEVCARDSIAQAINGYNSSILAYGQTGSGKTFTMFGDNQGQSGIIPRVANLLFQTISLHP